jgi:GT2 family glycosyltransferase/glycosyltransferase involved in cell wall biosynthesis
MNTLLLARLLLRRLGFGFGELPSGFSEREYLLANPDVARAVETGTFKSGAQHWLAVGRHENRGLTLSPPLPGEFDPEAYLEMNPDVALAIARGQFSSALDHFAFYGSREGRLWRRVSSRAEGKGQSNLSASSRGTSPSASEADEGANFNRHRSALEGATQPLPPNPLDYAFANPDVARAIGSGGETLRAHWRADGFREGRVPYGLTIYRDRSSSFRYWAKDNAITFFGLLDAPSGLGRAARHYVSSLRLAGYPVTAVSIRQSGKLFETDPPTRLSEEGHLKSAGKVNIFHLNADMVHRFFVDGREHLLDDCYNIGIWVWELAHFRPEWIDACGALDEIWVPSEFCRAAIAAALPVPVFVMPHAVVLEKTGIADPRAYFRLPEDAFIFGSYFDVGSGIERKNPVAVIDAFRQAFGDSKSEMLVLKYHSPQHDHDGIRRLHELCAGLDNVRFIGRILSDSELSALRGTLDCFVSAHRSEGFGLNIAEAMAAGIPVIATLYSGPEDFCTKDDIYSVEFGLTELKSWIGPYPPGALWADPKVESLAEQMIRVRRDESGAKATAENAQQTMLRNYSADALAAKMKAHIEARSFFAEPPPFLSTWGAGKTSTSHFFDEDSSIKLSVVTPVYNIDPELLAKCVLSVRRQSYANWELILFDDGSTREDTIKALRSMRGTDPRIKIEFSSRNRGIAAATNSAIAKSSGVFVGFLDNDDELAPNALQAMADAINKTPNADVLYSDEDKLDYDGSRCDHYFKPDWSPEHLESVMYILHFFVIRRSLLLQIGGLREEFSGAQDYDLALRATRIAREVVHVPEILYHWRKIPGSAAEKVDAKPEALSRACLALEEHCKALGRPAHVSTNPETGLLRVQDHIQSGLPVTLLILTDNRSARVPGRGRINLLDHFLESILRTTKTVCSLRFVVVDNANLVANQVEKIQSLGGRVVSYRGPQRPFNFSAKANFALRQVDTEMLIMLNDDLEVITPDWVDALIGLAQRPTTGVVGSKLRFPNDTIQHCGIVLGINGHVAHIYHQHPAEPIGYNGFTHVIRNYLAVTGACIATRKSILLEIGGFDEALRIDYNDIDLCLKLHFAGYRNIFTPYAELYHFEGTSQERNEPTPADRLIFEKRWGDQMYNDPFYNPNLTRRELNFGAADPAIWDR